MCRYGTPRTLPDTTLAVVPGEVGDSAGGWAADGGVVSVMGVAVAPGVKGAGSGSFRVDVNNVPGSDT